VRLAVFASPEALKHPAWGAEMTNSKTLK
jgi:hypothetical protein